MADHAAHFVVGELVHQAGEHAHASVGHREGIHVGNQVRLEVQLQAVLIVESLGEGRQTTGIGTAGRCHGVVLVHPLARLIGIGLHIGIGQGDAFHELGAGTQATAQVQCHRRRHRAHGQAEAQDEATHGFAVHC